MKVASLAEFQERALWLEPCNLGASIEIVETENSDGEGRVVFTSPHPCLRLHATKDSINWLKDKTAKDHHCADGIIFEWADVGVRLHVVELKATVNWGKWGKIRKQFAGALRQAMAAAGVLGVEPVEVVFYTAYVTDKMGPEATPVAAKSLLGDRGQDWRSDLVDVLFLRSARHVKVACTQAGGAPYEGTVVLS